MPEPRVEVTLRVNGLPRTVEVPPRRLLSDALRHDLGLTGTHVGCEHGVCGCCTILLDGKPVRSCLLFAVTVDGQEITTVEGLAPDVATRAETAGNGETPASGETPEATGAGDTDGLHPIQRAFAECHGLQCGFCTPGFIMAACGLLADNPDPSEDEIIEGISGNLCRCTGYQNIIAAVRRAAELGGVSGNPAPARTSVTAPRQPPPQPPPQPPRQPPGESPDREHDR